MRSLGAITLCTQIDESMLEAIIGRAAQALLAERIILFGSAAQGTQEKDSGIAPLVVTEEVSNPWDACPRVRASRSG